ncbi:hypothetical protein SDRG_12785 [Saprolegnia diclina VS20]|uniref:Uncharacterized protein n=1 Tax=Saprolegnia diclina (strain VS20) TaxID=1156394 RepID=T0Q7V2_SAPDV|nr:hypothetical protein SDRG_12782 [Saprolegnia diclina VS20]XP_008617087.1 hypothetical protein SDRG_12785 [Saprolegnia diclina VS20]EQC29533.1 hypothetical protein SDRG_12782 [Saprolegnia diclina VS20]EQC29535.1 hypothetical protein SDRG_12785 [Saprolegnia diclina VS20]|eukprot:XP_008617085.1 hypothetical protein SDRG_12782 [Saprolegnia diclina VS20]
MGAELLPLVAIYQSGMIQDVRILTRLGPNPPDASLGPVHAVIAPWLARIGLHFVPQLCPMFVFSCALEYGRIDLLRELVDMGPLRRQAPARATPTPTTSPCTET